MTNAEILQPLLEKGDIKRTIEFAEAADKKLYDIACEGMNLVTASILADIPSVHKMLLIQKVGALFSSQEYCELLNQKMFTLHPTERERLKAQGVPMTRDNILPYCEWFNIFEIAFPWLPLSIFEDFAAYLRDDKKLILDNETIETVKENFLLSKRYSERELERLFASDLLKDPADIDIG
ncbi:hypothetical protein [Treponema pedis]|uniref:Uncharacterized protein n=2 Tax=Treponema pedis TaxID=409322 RepID=S5ZX02_9SPIR|nr:hypothetical protein [Treponema pedis]AGT44975.1 hypothetical protein TPE_2503 [Treponema pedis str. T A4]QOW60251.1 hypothetical protein IFE08_10500 [Treponema pedis]QSI05592.1 hypothetical protein DYQ05_12090 [Treponema pedis]